MSENQTYALGDMTATARMRGSRAAATSASSAPLDAPSIPMRAGSTSGRAASQSTPRVTVSTGMESSSLGSGSTPK